MSVLFNSLKEKLRTVPAVEVDYYKNSSLLVVNYKGKEVAHFQNEFEIDLRLSRSIIKREGLVPPQNSESHPDRSKNSIWIVQQFHSTTEVDEIVRLVMLAIELRQ
ncbi:MAG: luciferase family protein [Chloroflexota bacterium]